MNQREIANFKIHKQIPQIVDGEEIVYGFTNGGRPISHDSDDCLAKRLIDVNSQTSKFFVRTTHDGFLVDKNDSLRVNMGEFRCVSETIFDLYLEFLQTGNVNRLQTAERLLSNA